MMEQITRNQAFELLKKYNKDPFHIQHALTVEVVMRWDGLKRSQVMAIMQNTGE